ncbi:MAG TPA: sulfite exporter TauE/SafE family protein [Vicinamibacterales bacterium]|nr:sulfite exporter TauE/SafE family protein [Vicinamibacterales bacterium]
MNAAIAWGHSLTAYIVFVIFVATLIRSTLGFGEALVAVPLLALRTPVALAAPLAVLVSIVVASAIVLQDWRRIDLRSAAGLVAATLVGIPLGLLLLARVDDRVVKLLLGVIVIAFAAYALAARRRHAADGHHTPWLIACGFAAGVLGGAYGMNGPPLVVYGMRRGWSPQQFRATLQGYFLPASVAGMIGYGRIGLWGGSVTRYFAWSLPAVAAAVLIGRAINDRVPAVLFRRLVYAGLIVTGAVLALEAIG